MEKERNTTENAISLDENWEAYWVDEQFGWMIRCKEHPDAIVTTNFIRDYGLECSHIASNEVWKKLIFLDKMFKINGSR